MDGTGGLPSVFCNGLLAIKQLIILALSLPPAFRRKGAHESTTSDTAGAFCSMLEQAAFRLTHEKLMKEP
jgi:hypothetical protein